MERREWVVWLAADARIVAVTEGRPVAHYAIRLDVFQDDRWQTVHLFDNAHGAHDSHRDRGDQKLAAEPMPVSSVTEAIPQALRLLSEDWERIITRWRGN